MGTFKVFVCVLILFALYDSTSSSYCGLTFSPYTFYHPSPSVTCLALFTTNHQFRICEGKCESSFWFNPVTSTSQSDLTDQAMGNCEAGGDGVKCCSATSASAYSTANIYFFCDDGSSPSVPMYLFQPNNCYCGDCYGTSLSAEECKNTLYNNTATAACQYC